MSAKAAEWFKSWERNVRLSEEQQAAGETLEAEVAAVFPCEVAALDRGRRVPSGREAGVAVEAPVGATAAAAADAEEASAAGVVSRIDSAADFYRRLEQVDQAVEQAQLTEYQQALDALESRGQQARRLLDLLDAIHGRLEEIASGRSDAQTLLRSLREDAQVLVTERAQLAARVQAAQQYLRYFEELETLTRALGGVAVHGLAVTEVSGDGADAATTTAAAAPLQMRTPDELTALLQRLDGCVAYATTLNDAATAATALPAADPQAFAARAAGLRRRALDLMRDAVQRTLLRVAAQVQRELDAMPPDARAVQLPDQEASRAYLRFHLAATELHGLIQELRAERPDEPHGRALLLECAECFFEQRRRLVTPALPAHWASLAGSSAGLVEWMRAGVSSLLNVCRLESQLYAEVFEPTEQAPGAQKESRPRAARAPIAAADDDDAERALHTQWVASIASSFAAQVRPRILRETELETLVQCITLLGTEVLLNELPRWQAQLPVRPLAEALEALVADAQERTIYRTQLLIRDSIRGFRPTADDLDYPEMLRRRQRRRQRRREESVRSAGADDADGERVEGEPAAAATLRRGGYACWYPTVERTLRILSWLYRCVDETVFSGIAQEALEACVHSLHAAAVRMAKRDAQLPASAAAPVVPSASPRSAAGSDSDRSDGTSPATSPRVSGEPTSEHAELFYLWQLGVLQEQITPFGSLEFVYTERRLAPVSLRDLQAALLRIVRGQTGVRHLFGSARELVPPKRDLDSKQLLIDEYQHACEAVVLRTTRALFEPLLSLLAKASAFYDLAALKQHESSFAHPQCVADAWRQVLQRLGVTFDENEVDAAEPCALDSIREQWQLYFGHRIEPALGRAVRESALEALHEFAELLQRHYTVEERQQIGYDAQAKQRVMARLEPL